MSSPLRLMCVAAHPDDESLGMGGALAHYGRQGIETYVVTATRGERGRFGESGESPGPAVVGQVREQELRAAARELGVREVQLLDYVDGELDRADPVEAIRKIVHHVRRVRPHVVMTFDQCGAYGHPDHIAICQLTTAAITCAADGGYAAFEPAEVAHRVSKLYYVAWSTKKWAAYQAALKTLGVTVDGVRRQALAWPDWAITTVVDTSDTWEQTWRAVQCHETQMVVYRALGTLPAEHHRALWGSQEFVRVFSTVNGGRTPETDMFEGLR